MRTLPPKRLDVFAASPALDRAEYSAACSAVLAAHPELVGQRHTYIGTDGKHHFFQVRGVPEAYAIPVSKGWRLS